VLLSSSQPHHEVHVQGLGGRVLLLPMAPAKRGGVLGELGWTFVLVYVSGPSSGSYLLSSAVALPL
jgi:hypothetical protein